MSVALLAGCGGGGGNTPPPPAPVNQTPAFTSGNSATVVENIAPGVYRAAATDPEGSAVSFSISGGPDAARFNIQPDGLLSFFVPPNFDLPTDADLNNVYLVEIAASDGQGRSIITVAVTVTNSKEGVSVRRIATGFVNPASMSVSSDTHLLVAEKNGAIYLFNLQNGTRQLLAQIPSVDGQGVLSVAANNSAGPDLSFFVMYTSNGFVVVQEYVRSFSPNGPYVPNNFGPVLAIPAPDYAGGGWIGFDFQTRLLIATGDAGGAGDPTGSAQNASSRLGKVIRAAPNPDPFAGATPTFYLLTDIAKGLHQPVGGYADSGGLLIGDRGQAVADEIDYLTANQLAPNQSVFNFGWPFKEGFRIVQGTPPADVVDPLTDYARASGAAVQGNVGGAIAGSNINPVPSIAGHYIFADRSGAIFGFPTTPSVQTIFYARTTTERRTADFAPNVGAIDQPAGVVADSLGHLYILDGDGEIFSVEAG